jgi:hypothetical protein
MNNTMSKIVLVTSQKKSYLTIIVLLLLSAKMMAQIPNSGFETWSAGEPTGWVTWNVGTNLPITQTSDAHGGSLALQGTTLSINYPAGVSTDFSISSRYSSLKGWYKYSPVGGDTLYIHAIFLKGTTGVAFTQFFTSGSVSSYTQFTSPMTYVSSEVPDSAYIEIIMIPSGGTYHAGSTFKIDDLSFGPVTDVQELFSTNPTVFVLLQNYPNPFNPATTISFSLPSKSFVSLKVFDLIGREVASIVSGEMSAGNHTKQWNANNLPSGVYFYRLQAGSFTETKRLMLLK